MIGFGGLFIAPPAFAETAQQDDAQVQETAAPQETAVSHEQDAPSATDLIAPRAIDTPFTIEGPTGSVAQGDERATFANGTGPTGTTVTVSLLASTPGEPLATGSQTIGEDGLWSIDLSAAGELSVGDYVLRVMRSSAEGGENGEDLPFQIVDDAAEYAEPVVTNVVDGAFYTAPLSSLSGSGEPGAQLEIDVSHGPLTGGSDDDFTHNTYTVTVGADGAWTLVFDAPVAAGELLVRVNQFVDDVVVGETNIYVSLLEPVVISSITEGQNFDANAGPTGATGTLDPIFGQLFNREAGAEIRFEVLLDGRTHVALEANEIVVVVNEDGTWSADFGQPLPVGEYTLTADIVFADEQAEAYNFMNAASVSFTVGAVSGGGNAPIDVDLAGDGGPATLPATGADASALAPLAFGAAGLLLAGGAALLIARRKRASAQL